MEWSGKRVLVTGHTGFKGGWLSLDLAFRGANVMGFALESDTEPNLFKAARIGSLLESRVLDVRDFENVLQLFADFEPEIVFHLAAQPLVRRSYAQPLETFEVNVMGTANILEAVRRTHSVAAAVVVTTDKCYENREWNWGYRENDPLGGHDPYSASKAAAEIVTAAYRSSFFGAVTAPAIATVRAGNVIGGGDWSQDRLVPDMVRAFRECQPVLIRNPRAIRPWQHVLEPIEGYMYLAERLVEDGAKLAAAWNFGPELSDAIPVAEMVKAFASLWGDGASWKIDATPQPHEAGLLRLDCSKAAIELGWVPRLKIGEALQMTTSWYREFFGGSDMMQVSMDQISAYRNRTGSPALAFQTK
jgi:CDP-glucose 4,6-dehydratase